MIDDYSWHILTGEYPPQSGGVSDYSAQLAAGLAEAGAEVHVWAQESQDLPFLESNGVVLHSLRKGWSRAGLAELDKALDACRSPRRLFVQYAPNVWGYKGLNLGFCRWLVGRRDRGDDVRTMFHEIWYFGQRWDRPALWALGVVQRWMARTLLRASSAVYLSTPYWERLLRIYEPGRRREMIWLPVPSNIPFLNDPAGVAHLRERITGRGATTILGSFGTFSGLIATMLERILPPLLADYPERLGLLIGRGSDRFAARLVARHPGLTGRVMATGDASAPEVSRHLQVCDVLVQPYPGGLTTRRGSLMAGLAHGAATVSTWGRMSEPVWSETRCVALAPEDSRAAFVAEVGRLLASPSAREHLGALGRQVYEERCSWDRTVATLLGHTPSLKKEVG